MFLGVRNLATIFSPPDGAEVCPHCGYRIPPMQRIAMSPRGDVCIECWGVYSRSWMSLVLPGLSAFATMFLLVAVVGGVPEFVATALSVAVFALLSLWLVRPLAQPRSVGHTVSVAEIPHLVRHLVAERQESSFLAFTVFGTGPGAMDDVDVQFSIENGKLGFDWVSTTPRSRKDRPKVRRLAQSLGYEVAARRANDVSFLRVEDGGDLTQLCSAVLSDLYGIGLDAEVGIVTHGITVPPAEPSREV